MKKYRLFVCPAGTANGFHLIETARQKFGKQIRTIAGDMNPPRLVAATAIADEYAKTPPVVSQNFRTKMRRVLKKAKADFYIPLIDTDCVTFPQNTEDNDATINISIPKGAIALFSDKYNQRLLLREKKIPVERHFPDARSALAAIGKTQLIVKTKTGFGSRGVSDFTDGQAMQDCFVVGRCQPPEWTTDVLHWKGITYSVTRERVEVKSGVAVKCHIYFSEAHHNIALALCMKFPMPTIFNFQTMIKRGKPVITDLNPRIGAGSPMSRFAGIDFAANLIGLSLGLWKAPRVQKISECTVVRAYRELVMR